MEKDSIIDCTKVGNIISLFVLYVSIFFGMLLIVPGTTLAATVFSDNFDDNSIDAAKWTEADPDGRIAETGGKIVLSGSTASTTALISNQTFGRVANLTMIATIRHTLPYVIYGFKDSGSEYRAANFKHAIYFGPGSQIYAYENGLSRTVTISPSVYTNNTDYRIAIILREYGADYYIQGGVFGTFGSDDWSLIYSSNCTTVCSTDTDLRVGFAGASALSSSIMTMDDFLLLDNGLDTTHHVFEYSSLMVNNPTSSSVTLVAKTSTTSNITVDYGLTDSYGSTAVSNDQKIHKVLLSGLTADTTYHYRIIAADQTGSGRFATTSDSTFKTQSTAGNKSFNFTIVSDNQEANATTTASLISSLDHSFILHPGDNVHVDTETTQSEWSHAWDKDWAYYFKDVTRNIPSYYALGNHDTLGYSNVVYYADTLVAAKAEMAMPIDGAAEEFYYSFDYENTHIAVLDSSQATLSSTQLTWLENDLAATNKKWKLIMMHVPGNIKTGVYSISSVASKNALHNLAVQYGVQVILNGHSHVYHRWLKDGVFYVTAPTCASTVWASFSDDTGDAGTLANSVSSRGYIFANVSDSQMTFSAYNNYNTLVDQFNIQPSAFAVSAPSNGSYTGLLPTFSWTEATQTDMLAVPPLAISKYSLYVDNVLEVDNISSTTFSASLGQALSLGSHNWYVKATNNASQFSTTTLVNFIVSTVPSVSTSAATLISTSSVTLSGSITDDGGASTTLRGFNYGTTVGYGSSLFTAGTYGVGSYSQRLTDLTCGTTYYFQASTTSVSGSGTGSGLTFTTNPCADYSAPVTNDNGGTIVHTTDSGESLTLDIPAGTSSGDLEFAVVEADSDTVVTQYSKPSSSLGIATGKAYALTARNTSGSAVSSFLQPITVTLSYSDSQIAGITESTLAIYRYDGSAWFKLDSCSVDTTAKTITCTTTAFSTFAIFGTTASQSNSTDTTVNAVSSSGTSAANRVSNLLSMGFYDLAKDVATQYGIKIAASNQVAAVNSAMGSGKEATRFTRTLKRGMTGPDVKKLQVFLNGQGFILSAEGAGSPGNETEYFGLATESALIRFQNAYADYILKPLGLKVGTGIFGESTRNWIRKAAY